VTRAQKLRVGAGLTEDVARRAIYVDTQGVQGALPVVLGTLVEQRLDQVVFDTDFADAALAKELRISSVEAEAQSLLQLAQAEGRFVVGFSPRSLMMMAAQAEVDGLRSVFHDVQQVATDWGERHGTVSKPGPSLGSLLRLVGRDCPPGLDGKTTTKRLRDVRAMIQARGSYDALTPVAKGKWTKLLLHNRRRCEGMRALLLALVEQAAVV